MRFRNVKGQPDVNKQLYCQSLLEFQDRNYPVSRFLGGRWMFLKGVILILGIILLMRDGIQAKLFGAAAIGFVAGKVNLGLGLYRVSKITWPWMRDLIDWRKVEEIAQDTNELPETAE